MKLVKKGDTVCVLDYPSFGTISETTVTSSGTKYICVRDYKYIRFSAETLNNRDGSGKLFIGSKAKYEVWKHEQDKRKELIGKITSKLHLLSTIQLQDIKYQIDQLV